MNKPNQVITPHCITCESIESVCIDCQFERELTLDRAAQAIGYPSAVAMIVGARNVNSSEAAKIVRAAVLMNQQLDQPQPATSTPAAPAWLANATQVAVGHILRGLGFGIGAGATIVVSIYAISALIVFLIPQIYKIGGI